MWGNLFSWIRFVNNIADEARRSRENDEKFERELSDLSAVVQRVIFEMERRTENEQHEREKLEMRLRLEMLQRQLDERKEGKKLPPADDGSAA